MKFHPLALPAALAGVGSTGGGGAGDGGGGGAPWIAREGGKAGHAVATED